MAGVRSVLGKVVPGLVRPDASAATMSKVRSASMSLYAGAGLGGLSGQRVIPSLDHPSPSNTAPSETFESNPLLFAPIWRIAFRLGAIPIKVYSLQEPTSGGRPAREEAGSHPAAKLLRSPNPDITRNLLISGTTATMLLTGRCGWFKERRNPLGPRTPSNPIVALWPIPGNVLFPIGSSKRIIDHFELRVLWDSPVDIPADDICYFRLMPDAIDWTESTSPVGPLGDTLEFSTQALSAMTRLFRNALLQRLYVNLHGDDLEADQLERLRTEIEMATLNPYGIPIMESGATIDSMGEGPSPDLLKSSIELTERIVRHTFGFPEDPDNISLFYSEVIQPFADAIEQELERSFMPFFAEEAFPEFQFRELLAGTPAERAKMHQTLILSGQETPEEARSAENRPTKPGADELYLPLNVMPVGGERPSPRAKDTAGGIGGSEGKATTVRVRPKSQPLVKAAAEAADEPGNPELDNRWRTLRARTISGQGEALARRLRGALKDELRLLLEDPDPSVLTDTDLQLSQTLRVFMTQAAEAGAQAASDLITSPEQPATGTASDGLLGALNARVAEMTSQFSERRLARLQSGEDLAASWKVLTRHLVDVIGATETAWAFERGAADTWGAAGFGDLVVVRGQGECSTGICSDVVLAGAIRPGDVPTPLHPGCKCMVLPAALVG